VFALGVEIPRSAKITVAIHVYFEARNMLLKITVKTAPNAQQL